MKCRWVLPAFIALVAAIGFTIAVAEPVVTVEKTAGPSVLTEFIDLSGGELWVRRLTVDRGTETIPVKDVKAIDFGEFPVELNAAGGILMDPGKPGDTSRLWWAVDHGLFIPLLRTCRLDTGTARAITVLKMEKETEDRLARNDLAPARRRDLEIAGIVLLSAKGEGEEARRRLVRLRDAYRDDPMRQRFVEDLLILIRQELRNRRSEGDAPPKPLAPQDRPRNGE